ncbi:MAG: lysophospholipid acyltransferase family protein [Candidatus Omnitrophica bacterium]|nr:lysophospholipid acyltransferase family protein [Candidatus Omnitrophota bacterium]
MLEFIVRFFVWLLQKLPLKAVQGLGHFVGGLAFIFAKKGRRTALSNLQLAFGDELSQKNRERIARNSFRNLITTAFEICWAKNLPEDINPVVSPLNKEACIEAYKRGKGVLLIVPHMGNWEVCARWLTQNLPSVNAVVRKQSEPWMEHMLQSFRHDTGLKVIYNRDSLRQVLSVLRHGELVIMMIDQHMRKGSVQVDFFGQPAMTSAAAALLAVKTGCEVLVGACYRGPNGGWGCEFTDPVETTVSGDRDADYIVNTQRYVSLIEDMVRQHPEDWMWMHRRWRAGKQREASHTRR